MRLLVSECWKEHLETMLTNDFLLCDEEGEFVLASLVELAELNTLDFCSDIGSEVLDGSGSSQQVLERRVSILAMLICLESFIRWIFSTDVFLVVPDRQIVWVSCRRVLSNAFQFIFVVCCLGALSEGFLVSFFELVFDVDLLSTRILKGFD